MEGLAEQSSSHRSLHSGNPRHAQRNGVVSNVISNLQSMTKIMLQTNIAKTGEMPLTNLSALGLFHLPLFLTSSIWTNAVEPLTRALSCLGQL